mgnify:CR=1 FL=1
MSTPREIFLEMLKPDGRPERILDQYEALAMMTGDPINAYLRGNRVRGTTSVDRWGTTILFPADAPGPMPDTRDELKVLRDITHWRDSVHAPDLEANCSAGWEDVRAKAEAVRGEKLVAGFMGTGIFEQCHFLMGFEDTLSNLYEHPDEMHELIDYITDYRLKYVQMLIDNLHPDVIFSHDDWGTKNALFMKPEMWREFYKEPYRRFYGYIRERGVIAIHHGDAYLADIVEDMAELGIQCWQGVLPENNIPALQERLQGRMILMGGIGAAIDRADATEAEIRAYVRRALEENTPGGHYIPSITYGLPGAVYPQVDAAIDAEIAQWNSEVHLRSRRAPVVRRGAPRAASAPAAEAEAAEAVSSGTLDKLAEALKRGRRKRVLELVEAALGEGHDAQTILDALVRGMQMLGDDFSAGRAFVPEMLVAARSMNAATDRLKPLLAAGGQKSAGRVCLGTVRGDMHDIGKNLVKIMMEGAGLEVIDLGVDVSAETFVDTAVSEHCDIIACSALLTTTMDEMRRVVTLAGERGIRGEVKVMIGGAPITQQYCDEIGADCYTPDAAQAARAALAMVKG